MAKRKEQPPDEGAPAWQTTFSDLMNLLLCFFVLLFASSDTDGEKVQQVMASFSNASFSILEEGSISLDDGQIISGGTTQLPGIESVLEYIGVSSEANGNNSELQTEGADDGDDASSKEQGGTNSAIEDGTTDSVNSTLSQSELQEQLQEEGEKQSAQMYDEISEMTESYKIEDNVVMDYNSQYVSLDLSGAILFDAGEADIRSDADMFMKKVTSILEHYQDSIVEVEGHTDNVPIHNSVYESNRYLSTARATRVYEYIMENTDLTDSNMKVAGYGESRPVASNDTPEGRARNRRVTIKIYNQLNTKLEEAANEN